MLVHLAGFQEGMKNVVHREFPSDFFVKLTYLGISFLFAQKSSVFKVSCNFQSGFFQEST
jgi:hypothetical protein